ncbi:MAG: protein kinase [Thermoanaerobaculia bacterium]
MIGSRLGPYEVTAKLGAGGMGEVYRATDSDLKREVAIKVLPAAFTADPERLARFEREAQLLAQLHHPNIASIFGLEKSGGTRALVMELVDGPTLAERLAAGPLPVDESLATAKQIALALEAAHEKGIVHRDLKPQNVKLAHDGTVKVLDFGLAKAMEAGGGQAAADIAHSPTMMNSPTLTAVHGTQLGVILGTAAYMSPEQARGQAVDKRSDIWAFGVVLHEMLTGSKLFAADTVSDTLAGVLKTGIDLEKLPPATPPEIVRLLRRCLERSPKNRLHDIADARIVIDDVLDGRVQEPVGVPPGETTEASGWRRALPWVVAGLCTALALAGLLRRDAPVPAAVAITRLPIQLGAESVSLSYGAGAVLSPDGRRLAWVTGGRDGATTGANRIVVRDLAGGESHVLDGTEGAQDPVFSPDGEEVAYFAGNWLRKVPVAGGSPVQLAEVALPRGVSWGDDGYLVYNRDVADGLWRVAAAGGEPERLTAPSPELQERSHRWPRSVRGTRKLLFLAQGLGQKYEESTIELFDLDSRERTVVHRGGTYPRITRDRVLLYYRDRAVWASRLDVATGKLDRLPVRVLDEVGYSEWSGGAQFDISDDGKLVYSTGLSDEAVELAWFDPRNGSFETVVSEPAFYYEPTLSPDGKSIALQIYTVGRSDLWIFDLSSGGRRRLTFGGRDEYPVWSPDGRSIAYSRMPEGGSRGIARMRVDGVGDPVGIAPSETQRSPTSWAKSGALLFTDRSPTTHADVWVAWPDSPERAAEPVLATPANESRASLSPDGRWMLYESDESGRAEIYARSFPGAGGRWQISEEGGEHPHWSVDGRTAYFWSSGGLVLREIATTAGALVPGRLRTVAIDRRILVTKDSGYDVAADGRVLLLPFATASQVDATTTIVLGWSTELARKLGRAP